MIQSDSIYTEHIFKKEEIPRATIQSTIFQECSFEGCVFAETIFQNCKFTNCIFRDCDLSLMEITNSTFSGPRFENSKIIGVNWAQAKWPVNNIGDPPSFKKCLLSHSTFIGVDLEAAALIRCEAINTDFREANLSCADFSFTDLKDSLFQSTNLNGADFRHARNYHIDPSKNSIHKGKFSLPEAMALLYSMDIEIIDT